MRTPVGTDHIERILALVDGQLLRVIDEPDVFFRHVGGKHNGGSDDRSCKCAAASFVDPGDYPITGSSAFRLERESRACFPFLRRLHDAFRIRQSRC